MCPYMRIFRALYVNVGCPYMRILGGGCPYTRKLGVLIFELWACPYIRDTFDLWKAGKLPISAYKGMSLYAGQYGRYERLIDWFNSMILSSSLYSKKKYTKKYGSEKNDIYSFLATAFEYSSFLARQNCDYQFLMMEIVWVLVSYKRVSYIKKSVLLYLLLKIIRKSVWIWLN